MLKFQDTLPNPNYGMTTSGAESTDYGQPYASYKLSYKQPVQQARTIRGKLINRMNSYGTWDITINYNPMTKEDFDPVYRFLMQRRGGLTPFFVELPNYRGPKDLGFRNIVENFETPLLYSTPYSAGATTMQIGLGTYWPAGDYSVGLPSPGDLFTVSDDNDSLHTKAYMVTRVETTLDFETGNSPASQRARIHFTPGLQRTITAPMDVNFISPRFQVVQQTNIVEYSLNTEDLYSFSVRLKEALY